MTKVISDEEFLKTVEGLPFPDNGVAVNNVYATIQGEGMLTGVPMILLRLHGCGVGCHFCDTKETWRLSQRHRVVTLDMLSEGPTWCRVDEADLVNWIGQTFGHKIRWVLLTGGEPTEQNVDRLILELRAHGYKVALETSGTGGGAIGTGVDHVCVSPKFADRPVLVEMLEAAHELKFVIEDASSVARAARFLHELHVDGVKLRQNIEVCLQPVDNNEEAIELCIQTAQQTGWRVSLQTHKLIGVA